MANPLNAMLVLCMVFVRLDGFGGWYSSYHFIYNNIYTRKIPKWTDIFIIYNIHYVCVQCIGIFVVAIRLRITWRIVFAIIFFFFLCVQFPICLFSFLNCFILVFFFFNLQNSQIQNISCFRCVGIPYGCRYVRNRLSQASRQLKLYDFHGL